MAIERVTSVDGTPIAVEVTGAGEPLVLVHGAAVDRGVWRGLTPLLADRFEIWNLDRRGRGESGDAPAYDPEREVEDLRAVFVRIGRPLDLFGHSSGAALALEAARRSPDVRRLVLYEPPMRVDGRRLPSDAPNTFADTLETLLAAGDRAEAVRWFYRRGPGLSDEQIARIESGRAWPATLAMAHTLPYDSQVVNRFNYDPDSVVQVRQPTLLLLGGDSPPRDHDVAAVLLATLPNARLVTLPDQGHRAMATAPDALARELAAFLASE